MTSPLKYTEINLDSDESHFLVLDLVAGARNVLDVGCATGYLSEAMITRGCEVVAIEVDEGAAAIARSRGVDVRSGLHTLDDGHVGHFDCLVFADVLEHVCESQQFLKSALRFLRPGGVVVVSVPNIAHWSTRWELLRGRFDYTPTGLLDETHVRFFTTRALETMLRDCGLSVVDRRASAGFCSYPMFRNPELRWQQRKLLRHALGRWPTLFAFQLVWKAVKCQA
jgi:methionine biosynthesis protein MetW